MDLRVRFGMITPFTPRAALESLRVGFLRRLFCFVNKNKPGNVVNVVFLILTEPRLYFRSIFVDFSQSTLVLDFQW